MASSSQPFLTFRALLQKLLDDSQVNAILIGEQHGSTPKELAMMANVDLLKKSKRKVVFITEALDQKVNPYLSQKSSALPVFKNLDLYLFQLCQLLLTNNVKVLGAENEQSNPFKGDLEKMKLYQKDIKRISETNKVFAELVNKNIGEDTIVIFIGGASHPVALNQGNEKVDLGIEAQVKGSKTIFLEESSKDIYQENFDYENKERKLTGIYNFHIGTNTKSLYQTLFSESSDKLNTLILHLDNFISAFLLSKTPGSLLKIEIAPVLDAFNLVSNTSYKFDGLEKFITLLDESKKEKAELEHASPINKFRSLFHKKNPTYSLKELENIVKKDLELENKKEAKPK